MNFFSRDLINFTFLNSFFRTLLKKRSFINRSDGLAKFFIREKSFWRNIFKLETKLFKKCSNSSVRLYVREVVTIPSFILKKIHRDRLIITGLHVNPPFSRICILSPSRTTSPAPFRPTDLVAPERLTPKNGTSSAPQAHECPALSRSSRIPPRPGRDFQGRLTSSPRHASLRTRRALRRLSDQVGLQVP